RWVVRENDRPGATAWKIHGRAAGVSGFAGQVYAGPGQRVTLYVSTAAPWFRAQAFRMGYYQGKGARLIWTSPQVEGKDQPARRTCTRSATGPGWSPTTGPTPRSRARATSCAWSTRWSGGPNSTASTSPTPPT